MTQVQPYPLFTDYSLGELTLPNRAVMSSLTRARATNPAQAPTSLHAQYYQQRASAGLILTESVWVSARAVGFVNIPGIYTQDQIQGWQKVTDAVHKNGGRIFIQLVHSGSVSHPEYFEGQLPLGPSAINPQEQVFTATGFTDTVVPKAFTIAEIKATLLEYRQAAMNAKQAGFDGIELHAQIFTLIPQFLSAATNQRKDQYGGSIENRSRILFEILDELINVFPSRKVGIKFTPAAFNNGIIKPDASTVPTFEYILAKLNRYDLAFLEIVGPRVALKDTPLAVWNDDFFGWFRSRYTGTLMANLGFTFQTANDILTAQKADLISFGAPYIANPDLVERFQNAFPLANPDTSTFYAGEEKGYIDYPGYK